MLPLQSLTCAYGQMTFHCNHKSGKTREKFTHRVSTGHCSASDVQCQFLNYWYSHFCIGIKQFCIGILFLYVLAFIHFMRIASCVLSGALTVPVPDANVGSAKSHAGTAASAVNPRDARNHGTPPNSITTKRTTTQPPATTTQLNNTKHNHRIPQS